MDGLICGGETINDDTNKSSGWVLVNPNILACYFVIFARIE